jgi:glucose-1-phosphate cytidylyltransferase
MNVVILAGGKGTRLQEETKGLIPKPMVEVGGFPLIVHIATMFTAFYRDSARFLIAGGELQEVIADYMAGSPAASEHTTLVDTGVETQTGGRLLRCYNHMKDKSTFLATYGDGLADINFNALLDHHMRMRERNGVLVTLTAVRPPNRFGSLKVDGGIVTHFAEKVGIDDAWINGGFYVIEPEAFRLGYVVGDDSQWERDVLPVLANQGLLAAFRHPGWWHMCDTPRDLAYLRQLWEDNEVPWLRWSKSRKS